MGATSRRFADTVPSRHIGVADAVATGAATVVVVTASTSRVDSLLPFAVVHAGAVTTVVSGVTVAVVVVAVVIGAGVAGADLSTRRRFGVAAGSIVCGGGDDGRSVCFFAHR